MKAELSKVRLDKWLWAARFFKTRAKAKDAIDGGKVHVAGIKSKPSKEIQVGEQIRIRQSLDERTVIVLALSDKRRGAPEAQALYDETEASETKRLEIAAQRKAAGQYFSGEGRPSKRDRRQIHKFVERNEREN